MTNHLDSIIAPGCKFSTLVDLLRYRSAHQSSKIAFTFLQDGEIEADSLTYQQLDQQAQLIAVYLRSLVGAGERALMLYQPGLEFITAFFGCLYAEVVAVPAYPPRQNHKLSRLEAIVSDSEAKVVLTTASVMANLKDEKAENSTLSQMHWIPTENIPLKHGLEWVPPMLSGETLAFLQYTSGSTGKPKGVMVTHNNLLRNSTDLNLGWNHDENSVIVTWLPTFHDMGLIYGMLQPIYSGSSCYKMSPVAFLQKPIRWLQAISHYQGTHSGAPNFAYEMCVHKTTPEQRAELDLSSWRMALNGAEPVRADVLEQFAEAFKPSGFDKRAFCPGYGLAEATLKVSAVRSKDMPVYLRVDANALEQHRVVEVPADHPTGKTLVGCGWTEIDTQIVIAHPKTLTQCPPDEVGEIWVSGSTVPLGYWNRPQATEETFQAYLLDTKEGPFLRTGDLGFIQNGELFITGRIKDVMIMRGRNHYPQDIELTVERSHPALRPSCGAAFTIEVAGEERLIVAQEVERVYLRKLDVEEVVGAIRRAVSEYHQLQLYGVVLLKTASIPKTSSGKIQRSVCRGKFLENSFETVGEWKLAVQTEPQPFSEPPSGDYGLDELLQSQTSTVSVQSELNLSEAVPQQDENGHSKPVESSNPTSETIQKWVYNWLANKLVIASCPINPETSFADYGIDSVMAVELAQDLGNWLKHPLAETILWNFPTIKSLAQHLAGQTKIAEPSASVQVGVSLETEESSEISVEASIAQELVKLENLLGK